MGGLSIWHWMIILAVIAIFFGAGRIGNVMGEVGKGIKNFKQNLADDEPKKPVDASMSAPDSLSAPQPATPSAEQNKSTINQG